jgi:hypothetical protein
MGGEGTPRHRRVLQKEYLDIVLENQKFMFTYHADLTSTHPYASLVAVGHRLPAYSLFPGLSRLRMKSAFGAFNGPMVCWGGLVACWSWFGGFSAAGTSGPS